MPEPVIRRRSVRVCILTFLATASVGLAGCGQSEPDVESPNNPSALSRMEFVGVFGNGVGPELGEVTAAAVDELGRVAILDALASQVYLINSGDGSYSVVGGPGDGPGEFRDPVGLLALPGPRLAVLDRTHRSISIFRTATRPAALESEIHFDFLPNAFCSIGPDFVVLGRSGRGLIHLIGADGTRRRSIATADTGASDSRDPLVQLATHEAAEGFLACVNDSTVVHSLARRGIVNIVNVSSGQVRQILLPRFVEPIRTVSGRGVRFDLDPEVGFVHAVAGVLPVCGSLVTVIIREVRAREDTTTARVYGVDVGVDRPMLPHWTEGVPEVIGASEDFVVARLRNPVPAVELWSRHAGDCRTVLH